MDHGRLAPMRARIAVPSAWLILVSALPMLDAGVREVVAIAGAKDDAKLAPELQALYEAYVAAKRAGIPFAPGRFPMPIVDGRVVIDATASADVVALRADLEALGMQHVA